MKGVEAPGCEDTLFWATWIGSRRRRCQRAAYEGSRWELGTKAIGQGHGHGARRLPDVSRGGQVEEARWKGASVKAIEFQSERALGRRLKASADDGDGRGDCLWGVMAPLYVGDVHALAA
jgi:hypothetical protein